MRKIIVNNKFNNKRIQNILQTNFNGLSSTMFYKTLRKKDIKVNGKRISKNISVFENDLIEIYLDDKFLFNISKAAWFLAYIIKPKVFLSSLWHG